MTTIQFEAYKLHNLGDINFVLGKNGVGKSRLLRLIDRHAQGKGQDLPAKYIVPERAGELKWASHVEQNVTNDPNWVRNSRGQNQVVDFRQQAIIAYRRLELTALRRFESSENPADKFGPVLDQINDLLDNVKIVRGASDFEIRDRVSDSPIPPSQISSGESELISLGIESLEFAYGTDAQKERWLILDEPDVHLHPDLLTRLAKFLVTMHKRHGIRMFVASHSTPLLGAFQLALPSIRVGFMKVRQFDIVFRPVDDLLRRILPVFGAHPLSSVFNEAPPLLVEGEDDERIWQQVVRKTDGAIRVYPCEVAGVGAMDEHEDRMVELISTVYDHGIAYSLRDGDGDVSGTIADKPPVIRFKLACRDPENLILSDEVLASVGVQWVHVQQRIEKWLTDNPAHPHVGAMQVFKNGGYDRRNGDVKEIRNDLMGLIGSSKPWEVVVGGAIAALRGMAPVIDANSLWTFLGQKLCQRLIL